MMVYELTPEVENHQWLTMVNEEDFDLSAEFDGASLAHKWKAVPVEILVDNVSVDDAPSDFPALGDIPVFSERAVRTIGGLLEKHGELLALTGPAGTYYAYNVTRVLDALDERASVASRFDDGDIMELILPVFRPEVINGHEIFKIPQLRNTVFVTDAFEDVVVRTGLVGFQLRLLWPQPVS